MWSVVTLSTIQELKEERNMLPICVLIRRDNRYLIRRIVIGFRLVKGLTMFDTPQE